MLHLANGQYLAFIDDDDEIAGDYILSIMEKINDINGPEANPDCIVFDCICTIDGGPERHCMYGVEFPPNYLINETTWRGKPAHTMVWKSSLAKSHSFPDMKAGEDFCWVNKAWPEIIVQARISKVLYYYKFNHRTTETRN
jgi:hypothetical protein